MIIRTVVGAFVSAVLFGGGSLAMSDAAPPPPRAVERIVTDHKLPTSKTAQRVGSDTAGQRTEGIAGGYVYVPTNPFRTWDTRIGGFGRLPGGMVDLFTVLTDTNNVQRVPYEAVAVTYNLTVTDTLGTGYLAIYPADIDWPGNSSINWMASGSTAANGGTVAIGDFNDVFGGIEVYNSLSSPGTHYVIDITGYYI